MPELSIRKIIEKTLSGEIRIPSFQRGFVWEPEKVAFFIDSLYKGYPIGSLFSTLCPQLLRGAFIIFFRMILMKLFFLIEKQQREAN